MNNRIKILSRFNEVDMGKERSEAMIASMAQWIRLSALADLSQVRFLDTREISFFGFSIDISNFRIVSMTN